jgi:hypothetical protein
VSSLKSLHELAKASHANEPYIRFGNPLLDGEPEKFKEDGAAAKLACEKHCEPTMRARVASLLGLRICILGPVRAGRGGPGGEIGAFLCTCIASDMPPPTVAQITLCTRYSRYPQERNCSIYGGRNHSRCPSNHGTCPPDFIELIAT